ncbi:hypothetical protein KIF24_24185 [Micromonospora sp. Llam7]|uniref:hypothetical protein n=1 Tax=Micromonospora tarapacensis TaxID=2835305 RepID=UPI001C830FD7|nr:hypothetical protein [Micromonospora tarapacensis]MBX7268812.1 hypothetical protein [Micromonospora tarapacensis]
MDKHDRRELERADSLANWSFVGILVPIVGWVLAGLSNSTVKRLPVPTSENDVAKLRSVNSKIVASVATSVSIVVLSLAFMVYGIFLIQEAETQVRKEAESQAVEVEQKTLYDQWQQEQTQQAALETCLQQADSRYPWQSVQADSQRDPANTQNYVNLYYKIKGEEENSCRARY